MQVQGTRIPDWRGASELLASSLIDSAYVTFGPVSDGAKLYRLLIVLDGHLAVAFG